MLAPHIEVVQSCQAAHQQALPRFEDEGSRFELFLGQSEVQLFSSQQVNKLEK